MAVVRREHSIHPLHQLSRARAPSRGPRAAEAPRPPHHWGPTPPWQAGLQVFLKLHTLHVLYVTNVHVKNTLEGLD